MKILLTKPYIPPHMRMIVTMPISLLYLGSYIKRHLTGIEVDILDPDIFSGNFNDFLHVVEFKRPDIIAISVFSHVVTYTRDLISALKKMLPNAVVIIGGSHINAVWEKALIQLPHADYAICGEGEKGLHEFCRQMYVDGSIVNSSAISGLVYRDNSAIRCTTNMYNANLDEFDPLYYNLINIEAYFLLGSPMGLFRKGDRVAQIITTRGCPFNCTFCASPVNMGKKVRKRSTSNIIQEIEALIEKGADEIHIMDDNFTFDREHVINLCKEIINRKIKIHFCMPNGVRLDKLDKEMLVWMKKSGWYHYFFGVEVGSNEALKKIRKGITIEKIKEKIDMVKKIGFTTTGGFILGLPHDTLETMQETVTAPDKLGLDMAAFGNFTPLPGTQLYKELVERGEINENYLPSFSSGEVTYSPPGITPLQIAKLQRRIIIMYWLHPNRIKLILSRLHLRDIVYVLRRLYLIIFRPLSTTAN